MIQVPHSLPPVTALAYSPPIRTEVEAAVGSTEAPSNPPIPGNAVPAVTACSEGRKGFEARRQQASLLRRENSDAGGCRRTWSPRQRWWHRQWRRPPRRALAFAGGPPETIPRRPGPKLHPSIRGRAGVPVRNAVQRIRVSHGDVILHRVEFRVVVGRRGQAHGTPGWNHPYLPAAFSRFDLGQQGPNRKNERKQFVHSRDLLVQTCPKGKISRFKQYCALDS